MPVVAGGSAYGGQGRGGRSLWHKPEIWDRIVAVWRQMRGRWLGGRMACVRPKRLYGKPGGTGADLYTAARTWGAVIENRAAGSVDRGPSISTCATRVRPQRGQGLRLAQSSLAAVLPKAKPDQRAHWAVTLGSGGATAGRAAYQPPRVRLAWAICAAMRPRPSVTPAGVQENIAPARVRHLPPVIHSHFAWPSWPRPHGRSGPRRCVRCGYRQRCPAAQVDYRNRIAKPNLLGRSGASAAASAAPSDCARGAVFTGPARNGVTGDIAPRASRRS